MGVFVQAALMIQMRHEGSQPARRGIHDDLEELPHPAVLQFPLADPERRLVRERQHLVPGVEFLCAAQSASTSGLEMHGHDEVAHQRKARLDASLLLQNPCQAR